ncbi:uncharacterized protein CYBJADRAFT_192434 [Cyberlindnera jadinii NRRL Y-1542]|uniref:Conserved oligomeric Golgi complex subunit 1 n=1 Tax=Cyberlindnera jadinii (strain ATCC 18201 / CBS 1600 / BCRC 20928 / JCM 3617 / NBRC 0987 / NRRL Y-1542) TaxID=983966 RepID=A0A1E4RUE3_CYBJN|nr:hypothetical protein CYBJADRAFT_192434 [Cyberlindnera jadinii NRRL Y-1542]ODV70821.1 hypothetical protein CYBJADRAFT_192434 [Cyberlindnera jadinii NRRL Y-1542]
MTIEIADALQSNANELFEKYSLQDITELSSSLSVTAQNKHTELRTLVASQYRDLLSTADEIIEMNSMSKTCDQRLYDLCFLNTARLSHNMSIESNVSRFYSSTPIKADDRSARVVKNADLFLVMSELLNLNSLNSASEICEVLNKLPIEDKWFQDRAGLVDNKLAELEMCLEAKIRTMKLDELVKIDTFVVTTSWFNKARLENAIYETILKKITLENLTSILCQFDKFKPRLLDKFSGEAKSELDEFGKLLAQVDKVNNEPKLELYSLHIEDPMEYLSNIQYISNGLVYKTYQQISTTIVHCLRSLRFLNLIDTTLSGDYLKQLKSKVQLFTKHAADTNNVALVKYLNDLETSL